MGYVSSGCFAEDKIKAAGKVVLKSTKDSNLYFKRNKF